MSTSRYRSTSPQHQLFLEPEGETTQELYLNGFSSSLPMDIQLAALKKVPAFKDLVVYRPGYAIEYDYFDPTQLKHTLESKIIKNLFLAGQVNGTTGYEEAGGQGIIAGINAHLNCHGGEPFTLGRDEAYIGVLIDDLVTKGVDEPYRMFTSRAEYRILLRQDDADMRLTERAYKLGLVKQDRYEHLCSKRETVSRIIDFAKTFSIKAALINDALESLGTARLTHGCKLIDLLNRPQITIENIAGHIPAFKALLDQITDRKEEVIEAAEVLIKYQGYIDRERMIADKIHRLEAIRSHTTGKANMNTLEKILYVADYMEPNRDFPGVERLRELAWSDLDGALTLGLEMTLEVLREQGREISSESQEALRFLRSQGVSSIFRKKEDKC